MEARTASGAEAVRSRLDALVGSAQAPGIHYLVVAPDQIVFEYAGGWADIAGGRPLNAETTMMAYSMSKTVTAAAVLQLVEAQTVRLDDPIDRYVESQPYGLQVTVGQLISHTSGIPRVTFPSSPTRPGTQMSSVASSIRSGMPAQLRDVKIFKFLDRFDTRP